ncbi:unnamed protein product [Cochlearia groenlandica]
MDSNKEEAEKARNVAEEKMKTRDFIGAHAFLTKAQSLFPELEHITKLITICEVHSSADNKIVGLDNWYAILQVQQTADADTIKKQYRRLALLLHPDKNTFSGAEAAFKLVVEANRLLTDRDKRSQYDVRYRSHSVMASKQANAKSGPHGTGAQNFEGVDTFWTCCRYCRQRNKCLREYMNKVIPCSVCRKSFVARDIGCNGVSSRSSTADVKQSQDQGQNASNGAEKSGSSAAKIDKNGSVGGNLNKKNQEKQKRVSSSKIRKAENGYKAYENPKKEEGFTKDGSEERKNVKGETCTNNSAEKPKDDALRPQPVVKEPETSAAKSMHDFTAPMKNQAVKKRRKTDEKPQPSKTFEVNGSDVAAATDINENTKRKSSEVSYEEGKGDGVVSPPTKKKKSCFDFESDSKMKVKAKDTCEDTVSSSKIGKAENGYKANENPKTVNIPDPDFNEFEDERKIDNFAVNQVWSIRDSGDGMPRKYVRVKKVLDADFKLRITCLVPVREVNDESVLIACGVFKNGETKEIEDCSVFSGQMLHWSWNKAVVIYPRKGEIWAIFRDWNEEWDTSLEKHEIPYNYDLVEILSDYKDDVGIGVAYLVKLEGFVSLFHREVLHGKLEIQFRPTEMLRFSHKVPAIKRSREENESVQTDSYELDTAALPKDLSQVNVVDMEMDCEILKSKVDGSDPEAPKVEVKAKPDPKTTSPRKLRKSDANRYSWAMKGSTGKGEDFSSCPVDEKKTLNGSRKNDEATDVFKLRKSARLQTYPSQQGEEKKSVKPGSTTDTPKETYKGSLGIRKSPRGVHQPAESQEGESSKKQGRNGGLPSLSEHNDLPTQFDGSANATPMTTSASSSCKTRHKNVSNFKDQRSEEKFRVGQIWAIYSNDKELPREYVKIKKINTMPEFVLYVTHMELHPPSKEPVTRHVSCGDFKLKTSKTKILPPTSFSHQINPVHANNNLVKVYPRKGEIWALYKNCNNTKVEHDIVEVVEDYSEGREIAKAVALVTTDSNSPNIIQMKHGSNAGFINIPNKEMSNLFSHQIPAIRHQKRTTRRVQGEGYWELDPRSTPGGTAPLS